MSFFTRNRSSIFEDNDNASARGSRRPGQTGRSAGNAYDALLSANPQTIQTLMQHYAVTQPSTQTNQAVPLSAPIPPAAPTPYVISPSPTSTSQPTPYVISPSPASTSEPGIQDASYSTSYPAGTVYPTWQTSQPTYTSTYSSTPAHTTTSTYSSSIDSQGNITVPGLGTFTPEQVYDWATATDPATVASTLQQYGVDPAQLVNVYNIAAPTDVTYQQASEYLGVPVSPNPIQFPEYSYNNPGYVPFTTSYSSQVDIYGNVYVPGLGTFTPAQIYDWVRTTEDPVVIAQTFMEYGVNPAQIVDAYNMEAQRRGEATVTYEQAEEFLGISVDPGIYSIYPGGGGGGGYAPYDPYAPNNQGPQSIDIPTDLFPSSESSSESSQSSSSISGIDWTAPVASQVLPEISGLISNTRQLPYIGQQAVSLADTSAAQQRELLHQLLYRVAGAYSSGAGKLEQAMQSAAQGVQQAYGTADELERAARYAARQAAQSNYGLNNVLQQLNAIGMLNSTTGANVMSQALGEVLRGLSQQAYQASAQGQQAIQDALRAQAQIATGAGSAYAPLGQMLSAGYGVGESMADHALQRQLQAREFLANTMGSLMPQALSRLAGLDMYASSQSGSTSTSSSSSSDPLAPYRLMVDMMGLMS